MKRRFLCALMVLMLSTVPAMAEGGLVSALATPEPVSVKFSGDGLRLTLPAGLVILEGDELEAYEAAVQFDYPDAASTILAAVDAERGAALTIVEIDSEQDSLEAAQEAAQTLINDPDLAEEVEFGKNSGAAFACAIGEQTYRLYYFSDGGRLFIIGVSGVEQDEIEAMLTGLKF